MKPFLTSLVCLSLFFSVWAERLNVDTLNKVRSELVSYKPEQRKNAIKTVLNSKHEDDLNLLRVHLPSERNAENARLILDFFAKRESRKDFYSLLDYVKLSRHEDNVMVALGTLYKIHPRRLRQELEIIITQMPHSTPLLEYYISALKTPNKDDIDFVHRMYRQYLLAEDWAVLKDSYRSRLFTNLAGYISNETDFFLPRKNIEHFYLYSLYKNQTGKKIDEDVQAYWQKNFTVDKLPRVNTPLKLQIFKTLLKNNAVFLEGIKPASLAAPLQRFLLHYAAQNRSGQTSTTRVPDHLINAIIEEGGSSGVIYYVAATGFYRNTSAGRNLINKCKAPPQFKSACFRLLITASQTEAADRLLLSLPADEQQRILFTNLKALSGVNYFQDKKFLRRLLSSTNSRLKKKAMLVIPMDALNQHKILISALLLTDKDHLMTSILAMRLQKYPNLADDYSILMPGFKAYTAPALPEPKPLFQNPEEDNQ